MSNMVLTTDHAVVAQLSSVAIMSRIANATSQSRQAEDAKRLALIAIKGCGMPDCQDCYPYSSNDSDIVDDGPTASELAEIERETEDAYAERMNARQWRDYNYNPVVNTILW